MRFLLFLFARPGRANGCRSRTRPGSGKYILCIVLLMQEAERMDVLMEFVSACMC